MAHADTPTTTQLRILIVEDEALIRWSVAEALTATGHHVVEAAVRVPKPSELSDEQKTLLARLAELEGRPAKAERSVLDRVRELFGG